MNLLAFTGKMGSGKTTACDYLIEKGGYVRVNFKDALVAEMKERLPDVLQIMAIGENWLGLGDMEIQAHVSQLFTDKPPLMRALMQNYGTEVRRKDDPDYWTKQYERSVKEAFAHGFNVVTDDCRFLNEAETIKGLGGKIARIERSDITSTGTHQSEVEMDKIVADYILHTDKGQLTQFYQQIEFILQ